MCVCLEPTLVAHCFRHERQVHCKSGLQNALKKLTRHVVSSAIKAAASKKQGQLVARWQVLLLGCRRPVRPKAKNKKQTTQKQTRQSISPKSNIFPVAVAALPGNADDLKTSGMHLQQQQANTCATEVSLCNRSFPNQGEDSAVAVTPGSRRR